MGVVKCLNPWDIDSKHVMDIDGVSEAIYAGECRWGGGEKYVVYAIEGNVVDCVSNKNGKGYCENVSPTINRRDRHAVCFALEGNGSRPSHLGPGYMESDKMYTLNTVETHSVCYIMDSYTSNSMKSSNPHSGIHEADVVKCLGTDCLNPACNQGGAIVLTYSGGVGGDGK